MISVACFAAWSKYTHILYMSCVTPLLNSVTILQCRQLSINNQSKPVIVSLKLSVHKFSLNAGWIPGWHSEASTEYQFKMCLLSLLCHAVMLFADLPCNEACGLAFVVILNPMRTSEEMP
jgi:hypothetical protein